VYGDTPTAIKQARAQLVAHAKTIGRVSDCKEMPALALRI